MKADPLFKRFRRLRRLETPVGRLLVAIGSWLAALLLTRCSSLARWMFQDTRQGRDLVVSLRRAAWLLRCGPVPLLRRDSAFDFTVDMPTPVLRDVADIAAQRGRQGAQDRLRIAARRLSLASDDAALHAAFAAQAQDLLSRVDLSNPVAEVQTPEASKRLVRVEDAARALADLASVFEGLETEMFVLSGTFLGLIREGGFLEHDYDIDAGVMGQGADLAAIRRAVDRAPMFVHLRTDIQASFPGTGVDGPRPMLMKIRHVSGVPVDLFFHYPTVDGRIVHGSSLHHWFNSPFDLAPYRLAGVDVMGPADADRYLTENYGQWRIPVTEFNCTTDTTNLEIVRHPSSIAHFLCRLERGVARRRPDGPKVAGELVGQGILEWSPEAPGRLILSPQLWPDLSGGVAPGHVDSASDQCA